MPMPGTVEHPHLGSTPPGYCSPSENVAFADIPNGLKAAPMVPLIGAECGGASGDPSENREVPKKRRLLVCFPLQNATTTKVPQDRLRCAGLGCLGALFSGSTVEVLKFPKFNIDPR